MSDDLSIVRDILGEELSPDTIDSTVRDAASFIPRLVDAWYPSAHEDELPRRRVGELSYFVPESEWRSGSRGQDLSLAYDEGLTALLYVHRIVINSPLLMLASAAMRGKPLERCTQLLLTSLHILLSLKDLIDAGIVVIIGSRANYDHPWVATKLAEEIGGSVASSLDPELRSNIEFALATGCAVDIFTSNDAEYEKVRRALDVDHRCVLAKRSDAVHLSTFLEEVVPDAGDLDIREIVRIRQDDLFEQWRADLRTALRRMIIINNTETLTGEGIEEVRALMHEKAATVSRAVANSTSLARLRNHAASFAIGGIGATVALPVVGQANVVSEVAMLAGALGVGALTIGLDATRRATRKSQSASRALAYHYAFIAKYAKR
ncbi:hypothetical protein [Nonomuraea lactucae]|uniref:hypothetical protein n=1 Tax=Nonomuraea lactucae TaxID=2249762 RepID=UPI0013B3C6D3|nr:hypothetical protein [Nonomuraea lactucae]